MALHIWKSNDIGRTWSYLSCCADSQSTAGSWNRPPCGVLQSDAGLWEPEFSVTSDGWLVCHYSDETDGKHCQKLARVRTSDGVSWTNRCDTVASDKSTDRPGMAVVRKLPNGSYFMSYELCAADGEYKCVVQYRTSQDGWVWGKEAVDQDQR